MDDRRDQTRQKSFLGGVISLNKRFTTFKCIVRNITESGALLTLPEAERIPVDFDLEIESTGLFAQAHVVWRAPGRLGVALHPHDTTAARGAPVTGYETWDAAALLHRVKALELENERLRQRVRELTEAGI